jgi:WD40 repeat protein
LPLGLAALLLTGPSCFGQEPKVVLRSKGGRVFPVAFSPDGKALAVGCLDGTIELWDTRTWRRAVLQRHTDIVLSLAFSPDGKTLASGGHDKTVMLWDWRTGNLRATLRGHEGIVNSVAFSADGKAVASGSADATVKLWELATAKERTTLKGVAGSVHCVAFSPDNTTLAAAAPEPAPGRSRTLAKQPARRKESVRLWDRATGKVRANGTPVREWVWSVRFSPDSKILASGEQDRDIWLRDAASLKAIRLLKIETGPRTTAFNVALAFSPNGKLLASCGGSLGWDSFGEIWLFDTASGKQLLTLKGLADVAESVAFSPDGKLLAAGSFDGTVRLWDVAAVLKAGK